MRTTPIAIFLLAACAGFLGAEDLSVGSGGKYEKIADALAHARIGDRLVVKPGTYRETLVWPGVHGIQLVSEKGAKQTIIEGDGKQPVIHIEGELKWDTVIDGFTVRGGGTGRVARKFGAGLNIVDASPTIRNCIITGNVARPYRGTGGVFLWNSRAVLENNVITANRYQSATLHAGGVCVWEGMPKIEKNIIEGNTGEQEAYFTRGAGIRLQGSQALVRGNIVRENVSTSVGSALYSAQADRSCVYGNEFTANKNLGATYGAVAVEANSFPLIGGSGPGEPNAIQDNIHTFIHDPKAQEKIRNLHPEYLGQNAGVFGANWFGGDSEAVLDKQLQKIETRPPASAQPVKVAEAGLARR